MRTLVATLLLTAAAWAADDDRLLLRDEVSGYLHELEATDDEFVRADAGGGFMGWFGVGAAFWYPALDGDIATANTTIVELDELGIGDEEEVAVGSVAVSLGPLGFRVDGFTVEFNGDAVLTRDITFGGVTFSISDAVTSRLEINNVRFLGTTYIVKTDVVSIALQGGLSLFDLEGDVTTTLATGSEDADLPIPVAGVLAQVKLGIFMVELDAVGLAVDFFDVEGTLIDFSASVGVNVLKIVNLRAGYRIIFLDARVDEFDLDVRMDGFFLAAGVRF